MRIQVKMKRLKSYRRQDADLPPTNGLNRNIADSEVHPA